MSRVKDMMAHEEQKEGMAIAIALEAGVLESCEFHEDCLYRGEMEVEDAYKLASSRFAHGQMADLFESQRDLTDTIMHVVEENSIEDECPRCADIRDED